MECNKPSFKGRINKARIANNQAFIVQQFIEKLNVVVIDQDIGHFSRPEVGFESKKGRLKLDNGYLIQFGKKTRTNSISKNLKLILA